MSEMESSLGECTVHLKHREQQSKQLMFLQLLLLLHFLFNGCLGVGNRVTINTLFKGHLHTSSSEIYSNFSSPEITLRDIYIHTAVDWIKEERKAIKKFFLSRRRSFS